MKTGIITEPSVWLYGENRTDVVDELFMGWAVGILDGEESSDWCKVVTHYGYKGYLRKKGAVGSFGSSGRTYCSYTQEDLYRRDSCRQTAFISRPFADVMEEPSVRSRVLIVLNKGSFTTILPEAKNGYTKIRLADGQIGWIPRIFWEWRKENDGFLYDNEPETYFLRQKTSINRETLISHALSYLGTGYRWAGKSAQGIDCSGFTFMCYLMCGILIYRDAEIRAGYPVSERSVKSAEPGDLLYFPGHIAMYLGNQNYIHATGNECSFGCVINSLSKEDAAYREDLAEALYTAGSISGKHIC